MLITAKKAEEYVESRELPWCCAYASRVLTQRDRQMEREKKTWAVVIGSKWLGEELYTKARKKLVEVYKNSNNCFFCFNECTKF
jgi:hypothetical protein